MGTRGVSFVLSKNMQKILKKYDPLFDEKVISSTKDKGFFCSDLTIFFSSLTRRVGQKE